MSAAEPEGCFQTWEEHTCVEDQNHPYDHQCTCGVIWRRKEN